jgi:3-dehydroquinate synthase
MNRIEVNTAGGNYPIHIGGGLLRSGALLRQALPAGRVLIVTDTNVAAHHLQTTLDALGALGALGDKVAEPVVLEPGEVHKDLAAWQRILDALVAAELTRDSAVIALGGGVVGDLAGFAAATYLRGIAVIQVPTTLLAQVDAAVGGKTAVDHPAGKNLIGAFHQPLAVIADLETLATLDDRQYRAAFSEVIKHALIADPAFLDLIDQDLDRLLAREVDALAPVVSRCCEIKAAIVAEDEREAGRRAVLNLGHSFGHALELITDFELLHGEAVSIGLVMAASLAVAQGRCDPSVADRITALLQRAGLPVAIPATVAPEALVDAMAMDKKRDAAGLRLVLPEAIGSAVLAPAPDPVDLLAFVRGFPRSA